MPRSAVIRRAINPEGSRVEQQEAFLRALDDWVEHVRPHAQAIRDALGLPSLPQSDLRL
jgi:hypothetical protein